ncbi:hypothetical protein MKW94_018000 [Papaver nudicaule]|uniref:Multidrug resistance protein ABC transporter family protein n=1 Tax=Papaver nudicaule TaxID=74823 RepID=A0AA41V8B9_PAPNU|nr:hypothetical protein [Papaver nudicaule]
MGNYISHGKSVISGKVILPDGTIHEFDHSLTVAELMLEHPQQVVVEFRPLMNGDRPTPLPADKKLDMKKSYLMLPMKRGNSTFTADEARRILVKAKTVLQSGSILSSSKLLPLFALICRPSINIKVGHGLVMQKQDNNSVKEQEKTKTLMELMPEVFQQEPEFLSRQFSGKGWKPSLDTIIEKRIEKKVPHWLF